MTQKMDELIIKSKNPFVSLLLPTIVTSSHILKWIFFCNIFPIIEKNTKWIPKNQKIQNPAQTHKLYVDVGWVQKDIWVEEILLLEVCVRGGGF